LLGEIRLKHWLRFAQENRLDFDQVRHRITDMAVKLPDVAATVRDRIAAEGAPHELNDKLASIFADRSKWVLAELQKPIDG
jgi:UDP-3-O-acyl-N-acetylglucosamine deacetylase